MHMKKLYVKSHVLAEFEPVGAKKPY